MATTSNTEDNKAELNKLLDEWSQHRREDDYNPIPFLTKLSVLFEKETEDFHKQDPDPFDDRHPVYSKPNCSLGKLLKALTKQDDLLDVLINTYVKSRNFQPTQNTNTSESYQPSLREAAARLFLVIMPGLDALSIFTDNSDLVSALYRWATTGDETLRTYATGILASAAEQQDINSHYTSDNNALVPILLKRLWNYIEPGKFSGVSTSLASATNHEEPSTSTAGKKRTLKTSADITSSSRKRKQSDELPARNLKLRRMSDKQHVVSRIIQPQIHRQETDSNSFLSSDDLQNTSFKDNLGKDDSSVPATDFIDISECSNSSWVDLAPVVIGYSYSLAPPLSPVTCQRCILSLLIPLGEYQDLLSHFIQYKAIDLVRHYLDKCHTNDGLLTFSALRLLASLLCHNKIATRFIDTNGIQRLLSVRRPSVGATGVSLCIYYLAYNYDAMERVCNLPNKTLIDLVRYAIWLLECSHDSGQCHAALFFNFSFHNYAILKLFDLRNGLRYLLNMLSMLPIIRLDNEEDNAWEDHDSNRQTAKTACQVLKKYFETHLAIKASTAKDMLRISQSSNARPSSSMALIEYDRESVYKHLDFLLTSMHRLPSSFLTNWAPVQLFIKLDGTKLLLRLVALACDWVNYVGRTDIVRFALDCLAVVTLSTRAQLELCEKVNLPPSLTEESGISIILGVAEGEAYLGFEPEAQKSALSVIINCVCGPQFKFDGAMGKVVNGTPQVRVVTKSMDEGRQKLWECVKTNNGIKILLHLLLSTQPMVHADEIRLLACKALCGLSRCESVKQIMSKLPMFNSGQLQALTKQPVMQDGKKQHVQFCKYVEELTERVSGKPSTLDMDMDSVRKAHIVSQTIIRYDNKELLQLIHNHLYWCGLHSTANLLAKEASLYIPTTSSASIFTTPKNAHRNFFPLPASSQCFALQQFGGSGDAGFASPVMKKISFSRGDHAQGETPTLQPHSSLVCTPSQRRGKNKLRFELNAGSDAPPTPLDQFMLTSAGKVTVMKSNDATLPKVNSNPASLNAIVAGYLQNQHAQCKNPVVTVPEFSLLRPHCCPNPRFRVEAPLNIGSRCMRRQIAPRSGGLGGACCDRQLIYSRFRPHHIFRAPDEETVPYTCCAFTPDDMSIVLGNYQGDLAIRSILTDEERVLEGVGNAPIVHVEPAKDGKRLLVVEEGVWRNACDLFSLQNMAVTLTYEDTYYVEFSKTVQDKVIGTKNSTANIYDAETGQKIQKLERADLASHYSNNKATFSYDDELILSDGLLWDVRASGMKPIHKFDKFNANVSGVFHPQGLEVIINSEIWDLRNYHLLHTVPSIDQCSVCFNSDGTIIYAAKVVHNLDMDDMDDDDLNSALTTFMAIDAHLYRPLSVTDTKHKIYDLAVDKKDCYVAVIERQHSQLDQYWEGPSMSLCRMYEVGRQRGEDDEEEEDAPPEEDDEDNNDDDGDHDDDDFSDHGSGSSFDTPSFVDSLSSGSSPARAGRRRRLRRRRPPRGRGGGGADFDISDSDDDDDGWSTISDVGSNESTISDFEGFGPGT